MSKQITAEPDEFSSSGRLRSGIVILLSVPMGFESLDQSKTRRNVDLLEFAHNAAANCGSLFVNTDKL